MAKLVSKEIYELKNRKLTVGDYVYSSSYSDQEVSIGIIRSMKQCSHEYTEVYVAISENGKLKTICIDLKYLLPLGKNINDIP